MTAQLQGKPNMQNPVGPLVSTKFLLLIIQSILLFIIYNGRENHIYWREIGNVHAKFMEDKKSDPKYVEAEESMETAFFVFIAMLGFEFLSLLLGISIMWPQLTFFQCFVHLFGCLFSIWFMLDAWRYYFIWNMWILFGLIPFCTEILIIIQAMRFKSNYLMNLEDNHHNPKQMPS